MWECFSYYGMRVLLVLFMVQELQYSDAKAFGIYALYTTLVEFGGVIGGIIADRFLGLKRSIALGGITIALGHFCLTFTEAPYSFMFGLGLIIAGSSLFRSNIPAFLGEFYEANDLRRDSGFTLYYTGINIGGFLATIFCGFVAEIYGWHAGFGLAALGMLAGVIALFCGSKRLHGKGELKRPAAQATLSGTLGLIIITPLCAFMLHNYSTVTSCFPLIAGLMIYFIFTQIKNNSSIKLAEIKKLSLYILFLILFYGCEEQMGSTLVLFTERHVMRETFFGIIPSTSLITCNPLTIIIIGPLFSKLFQKIPLDGLAKIGLGFALLGAAFCTLYFGNMMANRTEGVSIAYPILSIILISLGELLIGPTVYATASEVSSKGANGLMMGLVTLGFSLANLFSGYLSQMMAVTEDVNSLDIYAGGFWLIGSSALVISLVLLFINNRRKVQFI
jgi:proton-dependent oligopeptide transporter, POT family